MHTESYEVVASRVVRRDECSLLDSHFRGSSVARAVLVVGEEGVGKSHLVDAFVTDLELAGEAIVLRAETMPGSSPQLFAPLLDLVQDHWDRIEESGAGDEAAALASAVRDARKAREILRLFGIFVTRLCDAEPVVLVADHVTEASEAIVEAFVHALRLNQDRPLYVVLTSRPGDPTANRFLEQTDALVLPVDPLTQEESEALVTQVLGESHNLDPEDVEEIIVHAGGNPRFLAELATARAAGRSGGATVRLLLTARLDRLSPPAREILEIAALSVRPVSFRFCALAAGHDPEDRGPLREIEMPGLADEREGRIVFPNPVVRDLVTSAMTAGARRDVHRRIAGLLRLLGARGDEVAHHALAGSTAGDVHAPPAISAALGAADQLLARGFPAAAIDIADRGLALDPLPADEQRLLTVKGEALLFLGDTSEASRVFETILAQGGDGHARIGLARALQRSGRLTLALGMFEECTGPEADHGRAEVLLGLGRTGEAWELVGRELERARSLGDTATLASALGDAALVQAVRMRPDAVTLAEEAVRVWEEAGEDSVDWPPLFALGVACESADLYAASLTALRRLRNWLDSRGLVDAVPRVVRTETISAFLSLSWGRMEEAIAAATDVRRNRPNHEMGPIRASAAALAALRGDDRAFQSSVSLALEALEAQGTPFDRALTEWWLAIGRFMRLELDAGLHAFERAAAGFRGIGADDFLARTLPSLATAATALGFGARAASLITEYRALVEDNTRPSAAADLAVLEAVETDDATERVSRLVTAAQIYRGTEHKYGMLHTAMTAALIDRDLVPAELIEDCLARCSVLGIDNAVYNLARG
ncbi:MAG: AAA family ATPase [Acidimicrobiia bacterium]|nr:AAA family ATPase [Acidimicrobiia bacterium]